MSGDQTRGLTPWKPGESGNPNGGSKKATARRTLRDFLRDEMNDELTPEEAEALNLAAGEYLAGQAAAKVIRKNALLGAPRQSEKALDQIIATEPKTIEMENHVPPASPDFIPSEQDQQELLGAVQASEYVQ